MSFETPAILQYMLVCTQTHSIDVLSIQLCTSLCMTNMATGVR